MSENAFRSGEPVATTLSPAVADPVGLPAPPCVVVQRVVVQPDLAALETVSTANEPCRGIGNCSGAGDTSCPSRPVDEPPHQPRTSDSGEHSWTWQTIVLVAGLVAMSYGFAFGLVDCRGTAPLAAAAATLLLVSGIITCVVPGRASSTTRRIVRALLTLLDGRNR
ncbi:hypothetical protein ACIP5Y_19820 [Nocardia sp. NPDC088792]|uniref:hypothetical protein n=1 Tax=Nocardia sp. NPDC088792 TaxID=3364332 RepID=UPI003813CA41